MRKFPFIKYLVFDLDDTLLRKDRTISSFSLDVLNRAKEQGYIIVFDTSRSRQNSQRYIDLVHPSYGIYNGGCEISDSKGNILYASFIDKEETKKITKYLNTVMKKISVQGKDNFYASDKEYKGQNAIWTDFKDGLNLDAYKILCFSLDNNYVDEIAFKYNLEHQNYLNSGWHRLSKKGNNKFTGLEKFLSLVNGKLDEVCYFGDDFGDIEVIEKVALGVAMENSKEEVLKIAKYKTVSCNNDGCAKFILENLLD